MVRISFFCREYQIFLPDMATKNLPDEDCYSFEYFDNEIYIKFAKTQEKICRIEYCVLIYEEFQGSLILCAKPRGDVKKIILLHLHAETEELTSLKVMIKKRNKNQSFKEPLCLDYSSKVRPTCLSSDNEKPTNLRGFLNQLVLIMVAQNFSLMINNLQKYGLIFIKTQVPVGYSFSEWGFYITMIGFLSFWFSAWFIQYCSLMKIVGRRELLMMSTFNITLCFFYAPFMNWYFNIGIFPAILTNAFSIINTMKLISYIHVINNAKNVLKKIEEFYLSKNIEQKEGSIREYIKRNEINDENLEIVVKVFNNPLSLISKVKLMEYFFFPTLCYQLVFPRTSKIRPFWVLKRIFELAISQLLMVFVGGQYIIPTIEGASKIYSTDGICPEFIEKILKMSMPCVISWICMFYGVFQCSLNILAEMTYFGDREFYKVLFCLYKKIGLVELYFFGELLEIMEFSDSPLVFEAFAQPFNQKRFSQADFFVYNLFYQCSIA